MVEITFNLNETLTALGYLITVDVKVEEGNVQYIQITAKDMEW